MQNAIVNLNGQILSPENAKVSVFDRSYLYGDSLYEVARSYNGKFFLLNEHLERLERSAVLCKMTLNQERSFLKEEIYRTFHAFQSEPQYRNTEAYARLIISRGVGKIGFGLSSLLTPTQYTIIVQPIEVPSPEQRKHGLRMKIVDRLRNDPRALDPAMKSGNYLNSLLAYLEAVNEGFDDALLCNSEGHVTEGTTFNFFYVKRGILVTSPLDIGILEGITRHFVLELAQKLQLPIRVVRFPKERLYEADEVFLTSSIKEVLAISHVDQHQIGNGTAGPITQKLHEAFQEQLVHKLAQA
jgi:branched-chain amino acid aminotransferase